MPDLKRKVKFGVMTDLHVDIMPDTVKRLSKFLDVCRKSDVDFIIELGDFCYPDNRRKCVCSSQNMPVNIANSIDLPPNPDKERIISMYNSFPKPSYHVIGNHDTDMCSKEDICNFHGGHECFYSFDCGGFHFIVLDPNYFEKDSSEYSYCHGNYFDIDDSHKPILPKEQLKWLTDDLQKTKFPSFIFSHQGLGENKRSIKNNKEVHEIFKNAPSRVLMCLNGHEHIDFYSQKDSISYLIVNSISNCWLGKDFSAKRFSDEIERRCPNLRYTAPYRDAVFAIIEADDKEITIHGFSSELIPPYPSQLNYPNAVTACVTSRTIRLK